MGNSCFKGISQPKDNAPANAVDWPLDEDKDFDVGFCFFNLFDFFVYIL